MLFERSIFLGSPMWQFNCRVISTWIIPECSEFLFQFFILMTDLLFLKCHRTNRTVTYASCFFFFFWLNLCSFDSSNMFLLLKNWSWTEKVRSVARTHWGPTGKAINTQCWSCRGLKEGRPGKNIAQRWGGFLPQMIFFGRLVTKWTWLWDDSFSEVWVPCKEIL